MIDVLKDSLNSTKNSLFNNSIRNKIDIIKDRNQDLINLIYKNPNLHIIKSAGNNIKNHEDIFVKNYLNNTLLYISNKDLNIYNKIVKTLHNNVIEKKEYDLIFLQDDILEISGKKINLDELNKIVSLSIVDYAINFQSINLIEQLEYLKNERNIDLNNQITIAKAFSYEDLKNNLKNLDISFFDKKYLKTLYEYSLDSGKSESFNEIKDFTNFIKEIKNEKPDLLYNTTYGSIINLNKYSDFYSINPINHDLPNINYATRTSAAAPQQISEEILNVYKNGLNLNYKTIFKENGLDYDYKSIGIQLDKFDEKENEIAIINIDR